MQGYIVHQSTTSALPFSTLVIVIQPSLRGCVLRLLCSRSAAPPVYKPLYKTTFCESDLCLVSSAEPAFTDFGWSDFLRQGGPRSYPDLFFCSLDQGLGTVMPKRNMKWLGPALQNTWTSWPHFKSTWDLRIWVHLKDQFGADYIITVFLHPVLLLQQILLLYINWGLVNKILIQVQLFRSTRCLRPEFGRCCYQKYPLVSLLWVKLCMSTPLSTCPLEENLGH